MKKTLKELIIFTCVITVFILIMTKLGLYGLENCGKGTVLMYLLGNISLGAHIADFVEWMVEK